MSSRRGNVSGAAATSAATTHRVTISPSAAPASASTRDSTSVCRTSRARRGAQRRPHRHFTLARHGAGEHQVGEIRTGDEEHHDDRGEQDEERRARTSDGFVSQRDRGCGEASSQPLQRGRIDLARGRLHRGSHLGVRLRHADTGFEARDDAVVVHAAERAALDVGEADGNEQVGRLRCSTSCRGSER